MAQAMLMDSKLRLVFETGVNEKGEPVYKAKTFSNLKKEATAEQINQTARALATLSGYPLTSVTRNDNFDIVG